MTKSLSENSWNIPDSDDETFSNGVETNSADLIQKVCLANTPERVCHLYERVKANGTLDLSTSFRRQSIAFPVKPLQTESADTPINTDTDLPDEKANLPNKVDTKTRKFDDGFDYIDDPMSPTKPTKRTPFSAKKTKKVTGSMTNVVQDLIRHKQLDELENCQPADV